MISGEQEVLDIIKKSKGMKIVLVGPNGVGKSTMFNRLTYGHGFIGMKMTRKVNNRYTIRELTNKINKIEIRKLILDRYITDEYIYNPEAGELDAITATSLANNFMFILMVADPMDIAWRKANRNVEKYKNIDIRDIAHDASKEIERYRDFFKKYKLTYTEVEVKHDVQC